MDLVELAGTLFVVLLGYVIGAAALFFLLRLFGIGYPFNAAAFLVLGLPLMTAMVLEATTALWQNTPGTVGMGTLVVFVPMLVAGALAAVACGIAQQVLEPYSYNLMRRDATMTMWVTVALGCSIVAAGLWRFWPEPTARLW